MSDNTNILPFEKSYKSIDEKKSLSKKKSIIDDLKSINNKKRIKLRAKKLSNGNHSLFFHIRFNDKQEYKFLKLYIIGKQHTKKKDEENLKLAVEYRDKLELELFQNENDFQLYNHKLNADYIAYFEKLVYKKEKPDKSWKHTLKHLRIFTKDKTVIFRQVNEKFCEKFRDYLKKTLAPNTGHTYFAKIKASLNMAIKDGIINKNPAQFLHISKQETQREFLTIDELKLLKDTPCPDEQTKRAFLFTCFTGLRISDVVKLTFDEIQNGYLLFRQKKTKDAERLKLSQNAVEIIDMQKKEGRKEGKVFKLLTEKHALKHLKKWASIAGINKNVTWHVGRHSFATLAITYGIDIFTVSKLLGHREIRTTMIYTKLIDKKKDEAIDKLPVI